MTDTVLWASVVGAPLVVLLLLALTPFAARRPRLLAQRRLAAWSWVAVLPAGVAALVGDGDVHAVDWLLLGTSVQLDEVGRPLLGLAAVLYGLGLAFVPRARTRRPQVLAAFLLMCFLGNVGVFVAADLVTFYLSFTLVSFVGYAAVVHTGSAPARRAGTVYLVLTVLGETAVLAALLLVAGTGTLAVRDAPAAVAASPDATLIVLLLVVGFGVKAGAVPLHVWLPLAHPAAPTPASALLSGVMLKAGLVGWLRFLPIGEQAGAGTTQGAGAAGGDLATWGAVLLVLALAGGFLAVPVGLLQDDPKVVLAYSSISQMGFLTALVGAALVDPAVAAACTAAAVVYAVHHGLAKGALFLGVQAWDAERLPRGLVAAGLAVAGLSLAGAPLTSGFVAKYVSKQATGDVVVPGTDLPLDAVLPWVGVGSTVLLVRFGVLLARRPRRPRPTPVLRDVAWLALPVVAVLPVARLAADRDDVLDVPSFLSASSAWDQSWPVLLGLALGAAAIVVGRRPALSGSRLAHPRGDLVPPGDLVVLEERAAGAAVRAAQRGIEAGGRLRTALAERTDGATRPATLLLDRAQRLLGGWSGTGVVLLVALAVAAGWAALAAGVAS